MNHILILLMLFATQGVLKAQSLVGKSAKEVAKGFYSYHVYKASLTSLKRALFYKTTAAGDDSLVYAYTNEKGIIKIILPKPYTFVDEMYNRIDTTITSSESDFSEGWAAVKNETTGLIGFIDSSGKIAIEPQYTLVGKFNEGLAFFAILEKCNGGESRPNKMGYIDKTNNRVIVVPKKLAELYACCYFDGGEFRNGVAIMSVAEFGFDCNCRATIIIDKKGKVLNYTGQLLDAKNKPIKIE
ncbi:MAG TPA: WG repeat-containing protein [Bacteroidia bacterium]